MRMIMGRMTLVHRLNGKNAIQISHHLIVGGCSKAQVCSDPFIHGQYFCTALFKDRIAGSTIFRFGSDNLNIENTESLFEGFDNIEDQSILRREVIHNGRMGNADFFSKIAQRKTVIAAH